MSEKTEDMIEMTVPCKPEYVRTARRAVAEFARAASVPKPAVDEIEIAAGEAVTNIVRHAYVGRERSLPIKVKCTGADDRFTVEVIDKGSGFDPAVVDVPEPTDFDREGGLGIVIIRGLMDQVEYSSRPNRGTRVRMTKLPPGHSGSAKPAPSATSRQLTSAAR